VGQVKKDWMEQQELQPMYEWIEDHYGDLNQDDNELEWEEAVTEYNELLDGIQAHEAYEHAADEYNYYIHVQLEEADNRFSSDYFKLLQIVTNSGDVIEPTLYKMCYAHAVTLFEVYMEGIAKSLVSNNDEFMMNYLRNSNAVSSKKYSLKDLLVNKSKLGQELDAKELRIKALEALSGFLYHDIDKVVNAFESVLDKGFGFDKSSIKRVVHIRHDVVHRNGVNKKGDVHVIDQVACIEAMSELKSNAERLRSIIGQLPC
jgi:hypothetical protein